VREDWYRECNIWGLYSAAHVIDGHRGFVIILNRRKKKWLSLSSQEDELQRLGIGRLFAEDNDEGPTSDNNILVEENQATIVMGESSTPSFALSPNMEDHESNSKASNHQETLTATAKRKREIDFRQVERQCE
jgi:hypothetical protein